MTNFKTKKKADVIDHMINNDNLNLTAVEAVELLRQKKLKVATAESCTSGMLSSLITSVSGSSEIFELGISAYSSRIKEEALSVPAEVLKAQGAISKETAMYLAKNVRSLSDSNIGIGITGNAGPTADENKPVGLVFVGIADKNGYFVKELNLSPLYSREEIRSIASFEALSLIKAYAESYPVVPSFFIPFSEPKLNTEIKKESAPVPMNAFLPLEGDELEAALLDKNDVFSSPKEILTEENNTTIEPDDTVLISDTFDTFESEDLIKEEQSVNKMELIKAIINNIKVFLLGLWDKVKIRKQSGLKDNITKVVFLISLLTFLVSAVVLGWHFISDFKQQSVMDSAQGLYDELVTNEEDASKLFDALRQENPDIKAWITIKNTKVNHAICQTTDNDFYLHHNMYKGKSRYGALFFDCRNTFETDDRSQNLTIYGHNMNDDSMFGTLKKYQNLDFYRENPTFTLTTPEGFETYAIFSVMIMNAVSSDDNGYLYGFTRSSFSSQEQFLSWIAESKERSLIVTDININPEDQIITLVSCADEKTSFRNARFVIMAKKLDAFEAATFAVRAFHNANPRYPQAWYDARGLKGYTPSPTSSDSTTSQDVQSEVSSDVLSSDVFSSTVQNTTTSNTTSSAKKPTTSVSSKPTTSASSSDVTTSSSSESTVTSETETSSEPVTSVEPPPVTSDTIEETESKEDLEG